MDMYTFINKYYYEIVDLILSSCPYADLSCDEEIEKRIIDDEDLWEWALSEGVEL